MDNQVVFAKSCGGQISGWILVLNWLQLSGERELELNLVQCFCWWFQQDIGWLIWSVSREITCHRGVEVGMRSHCGNGTVALQNASFWFSQLSRFPEGAEGAEGEKPCLEAERFGHPKKERGQLRVGEWWVCYVVFFWLWVAWKKSSKDFSHFSFFYIFPPKWWVFHSNLQRFDHSFCKKALNFGQGALDIMDALIIAQANPFIKAWGGWAGLGGRLLPPLLLGNLDTPPKFPTNRPEKWMVGRWSFTFRKVTFQGPC